MRHDAERSALAGPYSASAAGLRPAGLPQATRQRSRADERSSRPSGKRPSSVCPRNFGSRRSKLVRLKTAARGIRRRSDAGTGTVNQPIEHAQRQPLGPGELARRPAAVPRDRRAGVRPLSRSQSTVDNRHARFTLNSEFNGPVCFRLYRFSGRADWEQAAAASLGAMKPQRTWTHEYQPLAQNNHGAKSWPVDVENLGSRLLSLDGRGPLLPGPGRLQVSLEQRDRLSPRRSEPGRGRRRGPADGKAGRRPASGIARLRPARRKAPGGAVPPADEKAFLARLPRLPRREARNPLRQRAGGHAEEKMGKPADSRAADDEPDPFGDGTSAAKQDATDPDNPFADSPSLDGAGGPPTTRRFKPSIRS